MADNARARSTDPTASPGGMGDAFSDLVEQLWQCSAEVDAGRGMAHIDARPVSSQASHKKSPSHPQNKDS